MVLHHLLVLNLNGSVFQKKNIKGRNSWVINNLNNNNNNNKATSHILFSFNLLFVFYAGEQQAKDLLAFEEADVSHLLLCQEKQVFCPVCQVFQHIM